jgi:hypothetical protein
MGTVIDLTAALWRRVAALEVESAPRSNGTVVDFGGALARRVAIPEEEVAPRSSGTVVDFTAALWRRVAALEMEVAECRRAVYQAPRSSWAHKVCTADLIEAERRLSIAEGMGRDERA